MIIACPRCEASYAVDAAVFGPRIRVVQCSACDYRWSQRPHETYAADAGEGSPVASLSVGADDSLESSLQPIREAKPVRETSVSEPAMSVAADAAPSPPTTESPTVSAVSGNVASSGALGKVHSDPREQLNPPSAQLGESGEGSPNSADDGPRAEAAQPDRRFGRAFVAGIAALATITTLVAVLILLRGPILSGLPDVAGLYGLIGLAPDPLGHGLEIREVASAPERVGGENVLSVTGIIVNVSGRRELLPALRVSLYDLADEELQFVTVPHAQESLDAGQTVPFQATIPSSRPEARRLRVGFALP
jgi:predicted Zn finger-like uncharacterized protein